MPKLRALMLESGDWITPQFDIGIPFWGKPPLHTWLAAAGMALFGVGEFGARVFIFFQRAWCAGLGRFVGSETVEDLIRRF